MNTIILRRVNLGNDARIEEHEGKKVIRFSVAENTKYKDKEGNEKESTSWFNCNYWTNSTNLANFLKKGTTVNVIGKLTVGAYTNKSGIASPDAKVTVHEIDLLDRKENDKQETAAENENVQDVAPAPEAPDNNVPW